MLKVRRRSELRGKDYKIFSNHTITQLSPTKYPIFGFVRLGHAFATLNIVKSFIMILFRQFMKYFRVTRICYVLNRS